MREESVGDINADYRIVNKVQIIPTLTNNYVPGESS
jgi:hypothetical protein